MLGAECGIQIGFYELPRVAARYVTADGPPDRHEKAFCFTFPAVTRFTRGGDTLSQ